MRRFSLVFLLAIAALIAAPGSAGAGTQIGAIFPPPLAGAPDSVFCLQSGGETWIQSGSPGGQYTVPSAGVITKWSYQATASGTDTRKFKVARPAGGNYFTIVGEGQLQTPSPSAISTYPTRIAVKPGDVIGFLKTTNSECGRVVAGYTYYLTTGDPPPGGTFAFSGPYSETNSFSMQMDIAAFLEPDCDNDGLGDETQDNDTTSCHVLPMRCAGNQVTITGTESADKIMGTSGPDVIAGLGGNDKLSGLAGNDVICGGAGKDTLNGGKGNDKLLGEAGKDTLKGGPGKDKLKGGAGKDKQIQ